MPCRGKGLKSTRYYPIKHEVLDLPMRWNRVAGYARRLAEWRLFPQPTPNRVQSSLLELLRCEGGKESLKWHGLAQIYFNWLSKCGVQEWLEFYSNAGRDRVLMMLLGRNAKCVWEVLTSNSIENSYHSYRVKSGVIMLINKVCLFCEMWEICEDSCNSWD